MTKGNYNCVRDDYRIGNDKDQEFFFWGGGLIIANYLSSKIIYYKKCLSVKWF